MMLMVCFDGFIYIFETFYVLRLHIHNVIYFFGTQQKFRFSSNLS